MPDLTVKRRRPVWFNLSPLNLPVPGLVSIFHRVSGALLFLGLVAFLYLLELSLASEAGYAQAGELLRNPLAKLLVIASIWAFLHHLCAGIRHLFLDIDIGTSLHAARRSAFAVLVVSLAMAASIGVRLW
ncbi:MAG TPA: succinate dehydrogenase, cytochrome b556 subunit [Burkholderiales bacterium]|jgi:succinate dehydrogenase / fumarate reductase cytochrome b subunit|nr:succinate dehydrogenase, cytochrome b556 subunit [Burkholderiales bacterium]